MMQTAIDRFLLGITDEVLDQASYFTFCYMHAHADQSLNFTDLIRIGVRYAIFGGEWPNGYKPN